MVVGGSPHLLGSFWVRPEHCSTRTCCHSCYSPPASKLRAQGWRSRAPFLSRNTESCLCVFSVLQNWQIIVLCHFLVVTPDWKGCLTSRDVLCVRRSIRFVRRPFWSFFFIFLVSLFMLPGLVSVTAYPLYTFYSLIHLKENAFFLLSGGCCCSSSQDLNN